MTSEGLVPRWRHLSIVIVGAAAFAFVPGGPFHPAFGGAAYAQHTGGSHGGGGHDGEEHDDSGHSGGHSGHSGGHSGGSGGHSGGHGSGAGTGGHGQGAGAGRGQPGAGGRPVWAREGILEVELGRLNVVRAPSHVLQRAYDEALASLTPEMADFYSMDLNEMIAALSTNFDNLSYIDSPLQNLALFEDALDGSSVLTSTGEISNTNGNLLAAFLGVASDKNIPITADSVTAVTTILGAPVTGSAAAALAADADAIRIAVKTGHG
ncbi:MAG: hypothetical protein H6897_12570 [Rhodobacteraceae bacterium]|jgi:hypothetical protein|uniref:hypothetical protein n=1 Tax=Albidovulum sp. TaxID=1872424 RepID=UPI00265AB30D|nr:hypothetical protein [uncultured Defluviimonas sp.]MCC0070746.1 hypothetical protein [Paracoccaceae bacterium]